MKKTFMMFYLLFFSGTCALAQEEQMMCLTSAPTTATPYGYILPSIGTVNVLMVFAQFPDDNYDINNSIWIKGQSPANMNNWIH